MKDYERGEREKGRNVSINIFVNFPIYRIDRTPGSKI